MGLLIFYVALALGLSFVCSLMEAVILSVTHSHVNLMIKEGKRGGRLLRSLKENIDRPLTAILTLNTIANTIGATGVGFEVHRLFGDQWVAVVSGVFTFFILILSEVIPKTLGAANWKQLAPTCAIIIRAFIVLTYPFVVLARVISSLITKEDLSKTMSREEMIVAAETGVHEGVLAEKEQRIIKNLLRLNLILVEDVMTPRTVVFALQKDQTVGSVIEKQTRPVLFSRIPVYDKNIDDIIGVVLRYKIIEAYSHDQENLLIEKILMPIHSVQASTPVAQVLDELIKRREHLFVVHDDHGGTAGIVSLEDVIETLLGVDIIDEFDSVDDMRKFALDQWENRKKSRKYPHIGPQATGTDS